MSAPGGNPAPRPEPAPAATRPGEIENLTNRLVIHPLSNRLAPILARRGVHPNLVSLAGLVFGVAAALLYANPGHWLNALAALGCMAAWHVMDGADGQVARLTAKTSATGRVVDGFVDYSVFSLVYLALAWASYPDYGAWAFVVGLAAGFSHIPQAALYELQREKYRAWTAPDAPLPRGRTPQGERWQEGRFWWLEWGYVRLQRLVDGDGIVIPGGGERPDPGRRQSIADAYRARYAAPVHSWGILSANSHTLAIFVFAVAGWPLGYFLFNLVVLNLAMITLLARTRALDRDFSAFLAGHSDQAP